MVEMHRQRIANRPPGANLKATSKRLGAWLAIGSIYVGLLILYGLNQRDIVWLQVELSRLEKNYQVLSDQKDNLNAKYQSLTSPQSITEQARALGLISSTDPRVEIIQAPETGSEKSLLARTRMSKRWFPDETE